MLPLTLASRALNACERISVCAGSDGPGRRIARYRIGTPRHLEFEYPDSSNASPIRWARTGYSGGGELQYRFINSGHEYIIYSSVTRDGLDRQHRPIPRFDAGVLVRREGRILSHLHCDNAEDAARGYEEPSDFMLEGEFIFWRV